MEKFSAETLFIFIHVFYDHTEAVYHFKDAKELRTKDKILKLYPVLVGMILDIQLRHKVN